MASNGKSLLADWEILCPIGPCLAFHVGTCIGRFKTYTQTWA
jgi:hypothetical protein